MSASRSRRVVLAFFALGLALLSRASAAGPVAGVEVPGAPSSNNLSGPPATPRVAEVLIDFEGFTAHCLFIESSPLRDLYLAQGVTFVGPGQKDGGAILDACSNFDVTGYSGRNFLAFNSGAVYADGGISKLPEALVFVSPVVAVSILVGTGISTGIATMQAYDAANNLVATDSRAVAPALAPLSVTAPNIHRVALNGPVTAVFDDLRFTPGGIVPTTTMRWGRLKAHYR